MKDKLVIWGENASQERVLIAMQLKAEDNLIDLWTFPDEVATEEFSQQMFNDWRNGKEVSFPDNHQHQERKLTIAESILPEDLKVKQDDLIRRAQTEWHFVVVSMKMRNVLDEELSDLEKRIRSLDGYSKDVWDDLKGFWQKVQKQVEEKLLYRDHANEVRKRTDNLFEHLKILRRKADEEFREISKKNIGFFQESFDKIEQEIEQNFRFQPLFEELRKLQRKFRDAKFTKEDRSKVWNRLDGLFKKVKAEKFGDAVQEDDSASSHLDRRLKGIDRTMGKIQQSIARDRRDLEYEQHRIDKTDGQLEAQIRQAKIAMIEERLRSKEAKLKEIQDSRSSVEKKKKRELERQAKREEQQRIKEAQQEAKKKIAEKIAEEKKAREEESEELQAAAESIKGKDKAPQESSESAKDSKSEAPKEKEDDSANEESILDAVEATLGETLRDVVDTAKAVALVVSSRGGELLREVAEEVKEEVSETIDKILGEEE